MSARAAALLADHDGHRLVELDAERTRCLDCCVTLLLRAGRSVLSAADRQAHVEQTTGKPTPCPLHVGELAHACRCCRADQLAGPDRVERPEPARQPTADVSRWAAACRAALPQRKARA